MGNTDLKVVRNDHMALTKSENSKAELLVFNYLRKSKVYFRKHYKRAPGSPDIAQPSKKRAVFIDGDFWHGRTYGRVLELRGASDYWTQKVAKNIARDKKQMKDLKSEGWSILRIWESDINRRRTRDIALSEIKAFLER